MPSLLMGKPRCREEKELTQELAKLGFKPRSLVKGGGLFLSLSTSLIFELGLQE